MTGRHVGLTMVLSLAILGALACRTQAQVVERRPESTGKVALILDSAHMFDPASIDKAARELEEATRKASVPAVVETIGDLRSETIEDASLKRAMQSGREGIYVLLARDQKKIEVRISRRYKAVIDDDAERTIRDAFVASLRSDPRRAIESGAKAIAAVLNKLVADGVLPRPDSPARGEGLVVRNQVRLSLAGARRIIEGAEAKAAEMGLKMNIAVVDDGGHPLAFARMDGARPASAYTATTKAITAATFRQASGPIPPGARSPDLLLNLSLQNAAAASGGKLTTLYGGVPVVVDEQVIGGVGVGGGSGEQDARVAKAGIEAFLKQLGETSSAGASPTRGAAPTR